MQIYFRYAAFDGIRSSDIINYNRAIAQLAERARHMREVTGSSPVGPTINHFLFVWNFS